jgi:Fic family protein
MTPLAASRELTPPWEAMLAQSIESFAEKIEAALGARAEQLAPAPLEGLLASARETKRYDVYHSTSLEGYRVTPEDVSILMAGGKAKTPGDPKEVENRMAVLGYSKAFDLVLERAQADDGAAFVDESLVHDVYGALFSPSVEKGIVDALSLIDYRKEQVYLRDSLYIPPSHRKVAGLMQTLHGSLRQITSPLVQAILWHYGFVTVHPYLDGNGRTARLLMNYRLLTAGLPWITILNDTRFAYFDSLSAAQVGGDILPFAEFVLGYIERAETART